MSLIQKGNDALPQPNEGMRSILDVTSSRSCDGDMALTREQRRAILSMCCVVARADGIVSAGEYERLLELLAGFGQGAVGFEELQRWLEFGPPAPPKKLPEDLLRLFLHEAVGIAHADGIVVDEEIATIKRLVNLCFENADRYR